jgi:uncharacterized membrane protein (GlpM family)
MARAFRGAFLVCILISCTWVTSNFICCLLPIFPVFGVQRSYQLRTVFVVFEVRSLVIPELFHQLGYLADFYYMCCIDSRDECT